MAARETCTPVQAGSDPVFVGMPPRAGWLKQTVGCHGVRPVTKDVRLGLFPVNESGTTNRRLLGGGGFLFWGKEGSCRVHAKEKSSGTLGRFCLSPHTHHHQEGDRNP